jgi:hypothetical protein
LAAKKRCAQWRAGLWRQAVTVCVHPPRCTSASVAAQIATGYRCEGQRRSRRRGVAAWPQGSRVLGGALVGVRSCARGCGGKPSQCVRCWQQCTVRAADAVSCGGISHPPPLLAPRRQRKMSVIGARMSRLCRRDVARPSARAVCGDTTPGSAARVPQVDSSPRILEMPPA